MDDATRQRLQRFPSWVRDLVLRQERDIADLRARLVTEPHEGDVWLADPYGDEIPIHGQTVRCYPSGLLRRDQLPVMAHADIRVQEDGLLVVHGGDAVRIQPLGGNSFSFGVVAR